MAAVLIGKHGPQGTIEIVRSFSYRLNCGNYESRDFFCSQKAECRAEDAETISDRLHEFCKRQVMMAVRQYQSEVAANFAPQPQKRTA